MLYGCYVLFKMWIYSQTGDAKMKLKTGEFYQRNNGNIFRVLDIKAGCCRYRNMRHITNGKPYTWQSRTPQMAKPGRLRRIGTKEILDILIRWW